MGDETRFTVVEVCTSAGTVRLVLDADGKTVPSQKSHSGKYCATDCPYCAVAARLHAMSGLDWPFSPAIADRFYRTNGSASAPALHFLYGNPHRGPPEQVV